MTAAHSNAAKASAARAAAAETSAAKAEAVKAVSAAKSDAVHSVAETAAARSAAARSSAARSTAARSTAARAAAEKAAAVRAAAQAAAEEAAAEKAAAERAAAAQAAAERAAAAQAAEKAATTEPERVPPLRFIAAQRDEDAPGRTESHPGAKVAAQLVNRVPVVAEPATVEDSSSVLAAKPERAAATPGGKKPRGSRTPTARERNAKTSQATAVAKPEGAVVLSATNLVKRFGQNTAVAGVDLEVRAGSFFGIVGPNGAGKTTTLSMITGLLRPDSGNIQVHGIDVWAKPNDAKRVIGVLPDRLRLFDRLTGAQLLYYSGILRGLDNETVRTRSADLAAAFGLEDALNRLVADYSAGMTKKIALACAMIHSPRVLVLDEPFESVDPVSAVNVTEILQRYVASGGTVVLSSHGMDLIQRVCDHVAIIVQGKVLASGTIDEVRGEMSLEDRFVELAGGRKVAEGMEWLHSFSD
jgi:ABC-2 type transport system ATP-binding protein